MRKTQVLRLFALALLLCGSGQVAHGKGALRNAMRAEVADKASLLSQRALSTIVGFGLLAGTITLSAEARELSPDQQQARQQHLQQTELDLHSHGSPSGEMRGWNEQLGAQDEEDNALAWQEEVTQDSGVFYIALRNPEYSHIHHVVYVGDTATGEPMFAGMFLVGHEKDYIRLFGDLGPIDQGFMQRTVKIFRDPLDLYAEVTVFTIKDLNLRGRYTPVTLELFPIAEVGLELQMLQYGVREDDPESLANLPLRQRACKTLEANVWGELGIGRHTCTQIDGAHGSSFGTPIFRVVSGNLVLVGFHGGTTHKGVNQAEGMTQELVDYVTAQQTNPTRVTSQGKVAATWGELKKKMAQ